MARFILDVANCDKEKTQQLMAEICELLAGDVATITCIDESNDNQFYEDANKNVLSEKQINNFKLKKL